MAHASFTPTIPGTVIGGLTVCEELGRGAQNVVYRAERDGAGYALKLRRDSIAGAGKAQAYRREAAMLSCLQHPGLVAIHEVGDTDGRPYLVMELLRGETLRALLARTSRASGPDRSVRSSLTETEVVTLAQAAAGALAAAHRAGLVHRDVKPDNLFVTDDGQTKVIDFGLATQAGIQQDRDLAVGTALYSPPEQTGMLKRAVDGRSDLYSLGVVLFECAAGRRPFDAADIGELVRQHAVSPPPDLRQVRPDLSPAFVAIVERLLAKDPDDRYQTGEGLLADLDRLAGHQGEGPADFAVGLSDDPAAVLYDLPLVGRRTELDSLVRSWRRAAGGHGSVAVVEGAPGQGKSRLVRELLNVARDSGALVLTGKAVSDDPVPLACLREAVGEHVRTVHRRPAEERAEAEARLRRAAVGSAGMLATFSPDLASLLGDGPSPVSADDRQDQFFAAVGAFLVNLAREYGDAVLCIDDVQWLDEASRRVLSGLTKHLAQAPLLLVGTARDDTASEAGLQRFRADSGDALGTRVELRPLDEAAVGDLIAEQLGGSVTDPAFVRRLYTRTNGNAFATVEYLRAVLDAGIVRPSWGRCEIDFRDLDRLRLPDDVIELVLKRVDDLGPDARSLLTAGAAVGSRFRPARLATAVELDERRLTAAVADALRARLIERGDSDECVFVHDRIREAMLEPLSPENRRSLHQRIAETLDALGSTGADHVFAVARHYSLGEADRTPERVAVWCEAAGRAAIANHAANDAADFFARAHEAAGWAGITVDADFEETFGVILLRTGDVAGALTHLSCALDLTDDSFSRARVYAQLARAEYGRWNSDAGWDYVRLGLDAIGHRLPRNKLLFWLGTIRLAVTGIWGTIHKRGYGGATGEERAELQHLVALYQIGAVISYFSMRPFSMAALALRSLPSVNRLGDSEELVRIYSELAMWAGIVRQVNLCDKVSERAIAVAGQLGDPQAIARAYMYRGLGHEVAGDNLGAGEIGARLLTERGRWLDIPDLVSAASAFPMNYDLRGYNRTAHDLWMLAFERARQTNSPGASGNPYLFVGIGNYATLGHTAQAAAQRNMATEIMADADAGRFRRAVHLAYLQRYMIEMDELGDYERVVAAVDALELNPTTVSVYLKDNWTMTARAAVERARRAAPEDRDAFVAEARRRVKAEGRIAIESIFRAHHVVNRAALASITGDEKQALKLCARGERLGVRNDAPWIHFEVARIRARVFLARDQAAESRRQARAAMHLAVEHGWVNRARNLRAEFGEDTVGSTGQGAGSGSGSTASAMSQHSLSASAHPGSSLQSRRSLDALLALSLAASQVRDQDDLARVALDELVGLLGAERAFLFLADGDDGPLQMRAARDAGGTDLDDTGDYASTVVEQARRDRRALVVTGTEEGAALGSESAVLHNLRSILAAPLVLEDRMLGVVYLDSRLAKGIFTADDVEILAAISNHIALSLEMARATRLELAVATEREQRSLAETLRDSMAVVSASLEPAAVADLTLEMMARLVPYDRGAVFINREGAWAVASVAGDLERAHVDALGPDALDDAFLRSLDAESLPIVVNGVGGSTAPVPALLGRPGSWISVPLVSRGEFLGTLVVASDDPGVLGDAQLELAATFVGQGLVAYSNAVLFKAVERLATTDELTKVNNRRHFFKLGERAFAQARSHERPLAVMMIDIDHFKNVNDAHGHAAGDDVIATVAERLGGVIRDVDVLGRYGGEEFALVLPETDEDVVVLAERLRTIIESEAVATADGELPITISVGAASMTAQDQSLADTLNRADAALYEAKHQGRNRVVLADRPSP